MQRQYNPHFTQIPIGTRVLYTCTLCVLGLAYMMAMIHIYASHAGRDGNPALSVDDLIIAYNGSQADTRLEAALKGPMASMLPDEEKHEIVAWVRSGAEKEKYESAIKPIVERRCVACHSGSNPHIPNLKGYDGLSATVELDTGMDIFTLIRVSHIHLFGITFIFFIVSSIFTKCYIRPAWLKYSIIAIPFIAIICDIGSWYLTKLIPGFAWVVMISGLFMGIAFAFQWIISIYQMWFYTPPLDKLHITE